MVLPTPPGPTSVTRWAVPIASTSAARSWSRPISDERRPGRLDGGRRTGGAGARPEPAATAASAAAARAGSCTSTAWWSAAAAGDGSMPSSVTRWCRYRSKLARASGWRPARYSARTCESRRSSRQGCSSTRAVRSSATRACSPRARRARASASWAVRRRSSSRATAPRANSSPATSPYAGPRHSARPRSSRSTARTGSAASTASASSTSAANTPASTAVASTANVYPGGGETTSARAPGSAASSARRSCETFEDRRPAGLVLSGLSPHRSSTRRSAVTGCARWTTRSASRARTFAPWMGTVRPSSVQAAMGPSTPKRIRRTVAAGTGRSDGGYGPAVRRPSTDRQRPRAPWASSTGTTNRRREPTMGKIVNSTYMTLDGDITNMQDWHFEFWGDDADQCRQRDHGRARSAHHGPQDVRGFFPAWSSQSGDESGADRMNSLRKYVVSNTLQTPTGTTPRSSAGRRRGADPHAQGRPGGRPPAVRLR